MMFCDCHCLLFNTYNVYNSIMIIKTVDIKFIAHDTFLESLFALKYIHHDVFGKNSCQVVSNSIFMKFSALKAEITIVSSSNNIRITFIRYALNQKIGKVNNLKFWEQ
jgi:hypothetical protein